MHRPTCVANTKSTYTGKHECFTELGELTPPQSPIAMHLCVHEIINTITPDIMQS